VHRPTHICGVARASYGPGSPGYWTPIEPAEHMASMVRAALADAGGRVAPADIDAIACAEPFGWGYEDLPGAIGTRVGLREDIEKVWLPAGGNSPQDLLHSLVARMSEGGLRSALLVGAECLHSRIRAGREEVRLDWTPVPEGHDALRGQKAFASELEMRHGMALPIQGFPLFENALRARDGVGFEEYLAGLGRLMGRNAEVARTNPHAWFSDPPGAEEIATVASDNRMVCYPYTKRMNALIDVDQAGALLLVREDAAEEWGIDPARRVTVVAGHGTRDAWFLSDREDFVSSPALASAAEVALARAGIGPESVAVFDLYSCFPSAVRIAMDCFAIDADDPRDLSCTGGLAYAGGPGNSYCVLSLAAMVDRLRAEPPATGLVTGVGMAMAKHAVTVLSRDPEVIRAAEGGTTTDGNEVPIAAPRVVEAAEGAAVLETFTVEYARNGEPGKSILVLRLADGSRTFANGEDSPEFFAEIFAREPIGRPGTVRHDTATGTNRFGFAGTTAG
jgi:acetyl-CoA C-acetyltransferase